ncbi:hypothetical protein YC2023_047264 [Brassica napus]
MAEEKSKKSFVLADSILTMNKLSLGPEKKKKKLLILNLKWSTSIPSPYANCVRKPENRSPDATCRPNLVYKRPFAGEFMKFCLERFEVGIWSSANESNVDIILNIVLEDLKNKLLFVWDQKQSTNIGLKTLENSDKPMFFGIFLKCSKSSKSSLLQTLFSLIMSPTKTLINPDNTGVFPLPYDPTDKNDDFLDPEGEFCSYLDDLANASDVQAYIKENSFGQPKIDSSHPDWSFYCRSQRLSPF